MVKFYLKMNFVYPIESLCAHIQKPLKLNAMFMIIIKLLILNINILIVLLKEVFQLLIFALSLTLILLLMMIISQQVVMQENLTFPQNMGKKLVVNLFAL